LKPIKLITYYIHLKQGGKENVEGEREKIRGYYERKYLSSFL
jgi:hypothetical protein